MIAAGVPADEDRCRCGGTGCPFVCGRQRVYRLAVASTAATDTLWAGHFRMFTAALPMPRVVRRGPPPEVVEREAAPAAPALEPFVRRWRARVLRPRA